MRLLGPKWDQFLKKYFIRQTFFRHSVPKIAFYGVFVAQRLNAAARCSLQRIPFLQVLISHLSRHLHTLAYTASTYPVVLGDVRKTSIFFNINVFKKNIDIYRCFRCFFFIFSKYLSFEEILGISLKKF